MTDKQIDVIGDFLRFYPYKSTFKMYRSALKKFFETMGCPSDKYFSTNRNYDTDLYDFALIMQGYAPKTFHSYINIVKTFFLEYDIKISQKTTRRIRRLKCSSRPLTQDRLPTLVELKRILSYADLKMKTLVLFLLSSGIRIGEAVSIRLEDMSTKTSPVKVYLRASFTKTKTPRVGFISDEASFYLKEWLTRREDYLKLAASYTNIPGSSKKINDDRIFPFTKSAAQQAFQRLLRLANLEDRDKETGHRLIHLHVFRKYFRTKMALELPNDAVEMLMGHEGYLARAYVRYTEEELSEQYKKGMHLVSVYDKYPEELKQLESEIKRRDDRIRRIEKRVDVVETMKELAKILENHKKGLT